LKIDHKLIPSYKCDIIVPIYNTSDELLTRCLSSIAMQVNLKDLHVIIVDDCSDKVDSSNIVNSFKNVMDIDYIKLEENVGAGKARNIGYERGKNEYVLFCDSDDSYFSAFSIEKLLIPFKENRDTLLTMCAFLEQLEGINFKRHQYNLTWIFSKIYRRSFLDKWNIRFPESRANEDVAFNLLVWACINDINKIKYCDDIVYMWHNNQESITRSADGEYKKTGMVDFVKSYIWTIKEKIKRNINDTDFSKQQNMNCIMMLYWYYVMMSNTADDSLMKKYNNMCYEFYCYIISNLTEFVNADNFKQSYLQSIHKCGDIASHYVPLKSIYDWLFTFEKYRKNKERR
jgi:glycosyltransferase involved in cell wall biosynthesis